MPELFEKVLRKEIREALSGTEKFLFKSSYDILEKKVKEAEENGFDVSDVREKMPELLKKIEGENE